MVPDAALSPGWPAFSNCMAREQAKLPPGASFSDAAVAACNKEAHRFITCLERENTKLRADEKFGEAVFATCNAWAAATFGRATGP
ncbi:MAG: hypothetical protein JWO81_1613 [Alphaproteobacteria bacterium]|nr:hypothetical protein [Alphaproteobacteria bacterium]